MLLDSKTSWGNGVLSAITCNDTEIISCSVSSLTADCRNWTQLSCSYGLSLSIRWYWYLCNRRFWAGVVFGSDLADHYIPPTRNLPNCSMANMPSCIFMKEDFKWQVRSLVL